MRRTRFVASLLGAVTLGAAHAQAPAPVSPPAQRSMREIVMMPVVHRLPGMDAVTVQSDLHYTGTDDPLLLMDVYRSPKLPAGERRPAVFFIHGGAGAETTPKDWGIYTSWGRLAAASGLVAVTFTHRLSAQRESLAVAASDVAAAIAYVRAHAAELGVDPDRICLAAYSAGGAMLAPAMRDSPPYLRCLVAFYAYMDLGRPGNLFAAHESVATRARFSPLAELPGAASRMPPLLLARAGRDEVPMMNDSIDRFIAAALARNAPLSVATHPAGVHGFDNQNHDERSREIIQQALDFLRFHLGV